MVLRRLLISGFKAVADPGISHDVAGGIWRGLNLLAELGYEHAQIFDLFRAFAAPDRAQQGAMRYHFAGVANHIHEQVKFFRSEMDGTVFDRNATGSRIDFEVTNHHWRQ